MLENQKSAEKYLGYSLKDYRCVTARELLAMSEADYEKLVTLYYENGDFKFADEGIYECEVEPWRDKHHVQWSCCSGDPSAYVGLDEPLELEGADYWLYTLLTPKEQLK